MYSYTCFLLASRYWFQVLVSSSAPSSGKSEGSSNHTFAIASSYNPRLNPFSEKPVRFLPLFTVPEHKIKGESLR